MELEAGVTHDILGVDGATRGMFGHDLLAVLVDRARQFVDQLLVGIGRGNEVHRADVEAGVLLVLVAIGSRGNRGGSEEQVIGRERFDRRGIEGNETDRLRRAGLCDRSRGHRTTQECRRGGAVGQHVDRSCLRTVQRREVVVGQVVRLQQRPQEILEPRARGPEDHTLTAQVTHLLDTALLRCDEESDVGRERHHRAHRIGLVPARLTADREVADGGVGQRQVQFSANEAADVLLGALGRLGGDLPRSLAAVGVEHLPDRAAHHEEGSARGRGADTQELPCRGATALQEQRQHQQADHLV